MSLVISKAIQASVGGSLFDSLFMSIDASPKKKTLKPTFSKAKWA
jgi:hypothetical protein